MSDGRIIVYTYIRVSTAMQVDRYFMDAQKARMKAFADFNCVLSIRIPFRYFYYTLHNYRIRLHRRNYKYGR